MFDDVRQRLERNTGSLLIVTGAGISVASGLPVFRGSEPDAVWSRDVMEMGTRRFFEREPVESWRWYLERFDGFAGHAPNQGHQALVALEAWQAARGGFLLVTQNIDGLHRVAGSEALIEVHGRADSVRCSEYGCTHGEPRGFLPRSDFDLSQFRETPTAQLLPRCPECHAIMRPHVLWFDETYGSHFGYRAAEVWAAAETASAVLFVGTSFSVGLTDNVVQRGVENGAWMGSIDPSGRTAFGRVTPITAPAEEFLPALVATLTPA